MNYVTELQIISKELQIISEELRPHSWEWENAIYEIAQSIPRKKRGEAMQWAIDELSDVRESNMDVREFYDWKQTIEEFIDILDAID